DGVAGGVHGGAEGGRHGVAVGDDLGAVHVEAHRGQALGQQRAALVGVDAGGGAVGGRDDQGAGGAHERLQSPDLPPVFSSTRMSEMTAALSTALIMSTTVRAATETAVSASISTPVRSVVLTVAAISTASSVTVRSTFTPETASGWHSGIRSGVRLAP